MTQSAGWSLWSERLTPDRKAKLERAASLRTAHVRLVVQDVHQPHNVSACLRSAEAFGVHHVDVVTLKQPFRASTVARGVAHWLDIRKYDDVVSCVNHLREHGYKIYAGLPASDALSLYELPTSQKIAVVFGNEHSGVDPFWLQMVDGCFTIPMVGLVESMNISVCAAIALAHLTRTARATVGDANYFLSGREQNELLNTWACRNDQA